LMLLWVVLVLFGACLLGLAFKCSDNSGMFVYVIVGVFRLVFCLLFV
jgi:hypothetical protein